MVLLSLDRFPIEAAHLDPTVERWFTTLIDQYNQLVMEIQDFQGNIIATRTANIGGAGAGPISVLVSGMTANSVIIAQIQSSTNAVSVQKVTATATGFDILFSGDPGASAFVNYQVFLTPKTS